MLFGKLFSDLSEYDLPLNRGNKRIEKKKTNTKSKDFPGGKNWIKTEDKGGSMSWTGTLSTNPKGRSGALDGWDEAYLDEKFKKGKSGWNENLAMQLKQYWSSDDPARPGEYYSAARVDEVNRTADGTARDGFSESNVKKYFWAFNRAEEEREKESAGASPID